MAVKKPVTEEQFAEAYKNEDNKKVIEYVTSKYKNVLSRDERKSCGLMALWRCLAYHDDNFNQKFTTSLWRFADWECKRELGGKKNKVKNVQLSTIQVDFPDEKTVYNNDNGFAVKECISLLPQNERDLIFAYYYENRTMEEIGVINGYTKEAVSKKLRKSLARLKKIINDKERETNEN